MGPPTTSTPAAKRSCPSPRSGASTISERASTARAEVSEVSLQFRPTAHGRNAIAKSAEQAHSDAADTARGTGHNYRLVAGPLHGKAMVLEGKQALHRGKAGRSERHRPKRVSPLGYGYEPLGRHPGKLAVPAPMVVGEAPPGGDHLIARSPGRIR